MDFDQLYRSSEHYFGREPNELVSQYSGLMEKRFRILDLGAGVDLYRR
jgi:hypothetical protein